MAVNFDLADKLEALQKEGKIELRSMHEENQILSEEKPLQTIDYSFPTHIISGVAGKFAELYSTYLEPPKEFFYFAFLT